MRTSPAGARFVGRVLLLLTAAIVAVLAYRVLR